MRIALISCTKSKDTVPCMAKDMYLKSDLFTKASTYVKQNNYDNWFILSAKYGLLSKEEVIEPYNLTLKTMKTMERKQWSLKVLNQLEENVQGQYSVDFYASKKYREYLIPELEEKGIKCTIPLEGKGIGEQLGFYKTHIKK
ncbi:hypothetical protein FHE72_20405 [Rossellomorea vietnamensis]|uniref:DUF6884 domain-containing protein n=1 Tax=Rossellomorea vietnamensis TaxID=218284 RepID=A0A6I6UV14_9BACI|nr:DUF6884 domain-containing protein [Rossellomorea vietnamensis]QHE63103.1 hypothetical protein FHE72_20405 [Rossellomorea vietnamensis]